MMPAKLSKPIGPGVLLWGVLALVGMPAHAQVTIDLCATTGTLVLPGPVNVPIWGYVLGDSCAPNTATLPGPELVVNAGDAVTINLTNNLAVPTSILISGQTLTATGGSPGTFTTEAAAGGGTVTYDFTAQTGTYLYESGTDNNIQVAMGLHGALVVNSGLTATAGPGIGKPLAYSRNVTFFDVEDVLVLSEIDPNLNADPMNFEWIVPDPSPIDPTNFLQAYHPVYWLINGAVYPNTTTITASPGERVLLRYVNASYNHHSMAVLDMHQRKVAQQGVEQSTVFWAVAEIIPAGTTADLIPVVRGNALPGTVFPVFNRNMRLTDGSSNADGGMQTAIVVPP